MDTIIPTGWVINPALIAWGMALSFVFLALCFGKGVVAAFLMKIYEFFIQRNSIKL